MKKIIIADRIWKGAGFEVYPDAGDIRVFKTCSNEEVLNHHRENKADLIITELYGTGMSTTRLCSVIREDPDLKAVSVIACRRDEDGEPSHCGTCRANLFLTLPLLPGVLRCAVRQLLTVPARASCRIPFYARCPKLNTRASFHCEAENISITGMLIKARTDLNPGDRINFSLNLPHANSYETQAEVVRAARNPGNLRRYGLRFCRLEPAARYAIRMMVERQTVADATRRFAENRADGQLFDTGLS